MTADRIYVDVILPLRLAGEVSYSLPEALQESVGVGSWVAVTFHGRRYLAVVCRKGGLAAGLDPAAVHEIDEVKTALPVISAAQMEFWKSIADYYLCTLGEVFKSACPAQFFKQVEKKRSLRKKLPQYESQPEAVLSPAQQQAMDAIENYFAGGMKTVLLDAVTAAGKTEIYMALARKTLEKGRGVLYLVPEIAMSRQLEQRIGSVFGDKLLIWHSRQTPAVRKDIYDKIVSSEEPYIMLGTRSALLLPHRDVGLVVVDEEHDGSYKQTDPAPRYHGRDLAVMFARFHKADILLGSATPSLESIYNARTGKYGLVELKERYYGEPELKTVVIDMNRAWAAHDVKGSFSMKLVNMMRAALDRGEQIMVFRSRRSYSSYVQCPQCGSVPRCPSCNVALSYHKFKNVLSCHYCGYQTPYEAVCGNCGSKGLALRGAGTEKLEEELQQLFPDAVVARFDADVTASAKDEKEVLEGFRNGDIDIMVGTQMITKGFDFANLSMVAVINADTVVSLQDFRCDEKALQLLAQLKGRAARRGSGGSFVIQTYQSDYPVLKDAAAGKYDCDALLAQRRSFAFPPYVRLISLTVRDRYEGRVFTMAGEIKSRLAKLPDIEFMGPMTPAVNKVQGQFMAVFWVKLAKNALARSAKSRVAALVEEMRSFMKPAVDIVVDVDPY
ncbi:MAG: primosomal protein N' [Bacteroidales bacterium]|nr:primosomal protein N' [Bacteroidales bacterium]